MARPLRLHIPGALYHVMSRGNDRQPIFLDTVDYQHFLDLLSVAADRFSVRCYAYCLIVNHFHLLLEIGDYPLSRMMQQLNSTYCQWFNRRHHRVGHLLQGRFKALLVDRSFYFLQVLRYVVLNPVEAGLVDHPAEWPWSSYRATTGSIGAPSCLAMDAVWKAFDGDAGVAQRQFADFVGAGPPPEAPSAPVVVGSAAFTAQVGAALEPFRNVREISKAERLATRLALSELFAGRDRQPQNVLMREAFRRYGYTLRQIGDFVGCHPSTVWRRMRETDGVPETDSDRQPKRCAQPRAKIKI